MLKQTIDLFKYKLSHYYIIVSVLFWFILINHSDAKCNYFSDTIKFNNGNLNEYISWYDNAGNIINAHDGGIIHVNDKYYWYGLALRPLSTSKDENNGAATTLGISLYSSKDLHSWNYEGIILSVSQDTNSILRAPLRFERPKIVYNKKTNKYIMWFHYVGYPGNHGQSIGYADAGVAISDRITGPFKFIGYQRPISDSGAVKDCTLFLDNDSTAYFVYDRKMPDSKRCLHVVKLSDDFLNSTSNWVKIQLANNREAPVVIKKNGVYFLFTSDVSGWKSNTAKVYKANNIMGPWIEIGNPCLGEGAETTFNSQGTYAFQVEGKKDLMILMLERHNTSDFMKCSYIWLPLNFSNNKNFIVYYNELWSESAY